LVELLIVVAIIAILAAIALPNFLQAQVRSRVSAAEMDMRNIAIGLESYRVDHNRYPNPIPPAVLVADDPTYIHIALSTPIVYLSKYMEDPFLRSIYPLSDHRRLIHYSLVDFAPDSTYYELWLGNPVTAYDLRNNGSKIWMLSSAGPDLQRSFTPNVGKRLVEVPFYDPTNGTPSPGEVIRSNMGVREVIIQMARP